MCIYRIRYIYAIFVPFSEILVKIHFIYIFLQDVLEKVHMLLLSLNALCGNTHLCLTQFLSKMFKDSHRVST